MCHPQFAELQVRHQSLDVELEGAFAQAQVLGLQLLDAVFKGLELLRLFGLAHLRLPQVAVPAGDHAAVGLLLNRDPHELVVRPLLLDAALVHDDDPVAFFGGGEPMSNHDRAPRPAALHHLVECCLDYTLGLRVQGAGGLVQQHDRRVVECCLDYTLGLRVQGAGGLVQQHDRRVPDNGARDGQALLLATTELDASFTSVRLQLAREVLDERPSVGLEARRLELHVRDGLTAQAWQSVDNVFPDRGGEQDVILRDDRHVLPQKVNVVLSNVPTVKQDLTGVWLIEAFYQLDARALAASCGADESHLLPTVDRERELVQDLLVWLRGEREIDLLELDVAHKPFGPELRRVAGLRLNPRFRCQHVADAAQRIEGLRKLGCFLHQVSDAMLHAVGHERDLARLAD
eukprot:CAMPEP_0204102372 /NCGR_PEP_ID=MMETSP0360-20130528/194947_1 /ASSEMBLY_ACC=CAM_ASM_000342 /TAXON_ID=268821 /ORGANISM="Scrippsiella Hangoei, Strain SHTV-5" /LENGTH=402 /DNA_ID=CAMNT_0051051787 /DNA_START=117 /DNA_END=1322 /DNA_ORIENTATION=+